MSVFLHFRSYRAIHKHKKCAFYSSCQLRRLRLVYCRDVSNDGLSKAAEKLPLLETFETCRGAGKLSEEALKAIGQNCPNLTTLKVDREAGDTLSSLTRTKRHFAIAKHMPRLCRLSLTGNVRTNVGSTAILDGCPRLESLDLRHCSYIELEGEGNLARKGERIKELKRPWDLCHRRQP